MIKLLAAVPATLPAKAPRADAVSSGWASGSGWVTGNAFMNCSAPLGLG